MTALRAPLLEELDLETCYRRLATQQVGRVVATAGALPLVVPVNFALDGHAVVFRTASGGTLDAATRGTVVAFEVDEIDPHVRSGWSVVVTGVASPIDDLSDLLRAQQLAIAPWAPGRRDHYVRITPGLVTGRHLVSNVVPTVPA
jgi:nitroimidazol reductase NimA-like FMN-containing flavoprotein (pyridoxamine 5'-phosphate oxidase superfamily)